MDPKVVRKILDINHQFYQTFAEQFSDTRQRIQPGVRQILKNFPLNISILDIGCGNGNLYIELSRSGFLGKYVGLDFSPALLAEAELNTDQILQSLSSAQKPVFMIADLSQPDWENEIAEISFDFITAFAVFHHIPGKKLRLQVLKILRTLLNPSGLFAISVWQILKSPRMRSRIVEWSKVGLSADSLEPGDFLMDWRSGGYGLRYVHHFHENELEELAKLSGFLVERTFYSDGSEGNLGLYQIWTVMN